eukprot:5636583-Amphidinium_carterae.3
MQGWSETPPPNQQLLQDTVLVYVSLNEFTHQQEEWNQTSERTKHQEKQRYLLTKIFEECFHVLVCMVAWSADHLTRAA